MIKCRYLFCLINFYKEYDVNDKKSNYGRRRKLQEEEILTGIMQLIKGEKEPFAFQDKVALSAKLKNLIALGSVIASQ